jgi:hypothetical protein
MSGQIDDLSRRIKKRGINGHRIARPLLRLERVITRDARAPLSADDPNMENGWRCIPVPPTDDPGWFIIDDSRDAKTVWAREDDP